MKQAAGSAGFWRVFAFSTLLLILCGNTVAHVERAADEMAGAAARFLAALDEEQREKAALAMADEERENFHFVPRARRGISFKDLRPDQRYLAHGLLASGLSRRGYLKATTIMSLERILFELESAPRRDAELYFFSVFGDPAPGATWGWRVEGHHLSLNFTIVKGSKISATPSFFGSNPAVVKSGPQAGLRALAEEEQLGRRLARSLSPDQRRLAVFSDRAPRDIITGAQRTIERLDPPGIAWDRLETEQRQVLRELIETYLRRHRSELADSDLEKIEGAGWSRVHFAWAGGFDPGQGHYYRVQGATFLLEYDNTQNGANHIHAVYRDFQDDFGRDLLKEHYQARH